MNTSWQRWAAARPQAAEAGALALAAAATISGVLVTRGIMATPPLWPALTLAVVACAALHWRRARPLPVLAVTLLCAMGIGALGYLLTPLLMGPLLAAQYSLSVHAPRRTTWNSALAAALGMVATGLFFPPFHSSPVLSIVNPTAWVLLAAAFGSYVRVRREYAAARAEHAAREREEEARHRVFQERMRIARELHDVVAHHLTLADAQASTAAHLAATHPDQALAIIGKLPQTTSAALHELKATVGLLRQDTDHGDDLTPAPGLRDLPELVDACAAAGLTVTVGVEGQARRLTPVLDLTAYRIVQEALTNVSKHAATPAARVRLAYAPHRLTLSVTNDAAPGGPPDITGGFGLITMRERATAAGGTFHAGRRPQGGFEVACTLPLDDRDEDLGEDLRETLEELRQGSHATRPPESPAL
ncbi:sensor histidine kinase [Streptomyces aquilus]|uniref:histidine kinase n=1 Tax=Streptomyces aquilus TaxID=2548456 RepID=A0A3S9ID71_9ACTN|nr:sensor histidine kinase [Streptomyces aquilus]AZP22294.1 sensor histidine kinase [Streptomyces aquilus]